MHYKQGCSGWLVGWALQGSSGYARELYFGQQSIRERAQGLWSQI